MSTNAQDEVRFARDSPLEEAVTSEPVSGNADSRWILDDSGSLKRVI
jgi:hypothetical protein